MNEFNLLLFLKYLEMSSRGRGTRHDKISAFAGGYGATSKHRYNTQTRKLMRRSSAFAEGATA